MSDQGQPNRLIHETSPYLLQHAYNPVDWYPWGEEAFATARDRDLPIFLSIGYSACHWCHVMERESFENPQVAELMNRWFINIKVDREERPDLDQIYMTAVQLITGQGGWPMSVFLTADGEPFFGGTYWPPTSRGGMLGFATILERLHEYWQNDRQECFNKGGELTQAIDQLHHHEQARCPLQIDLLRHAQHRLIQNADMQEGGFGHAPKFPHPADLRVLMRTWKRFETPEALQAVTITLDKMADGGIYDHLGGGFARYSTDRYWLVPHFEKMLYDNSQLVLAYLEGWQTTGNERYRDVVVETLTYIEREMTDESGGFYSTQDADSEGVEGKFYVWSEAEIDQLLSPESARRFKHCYQISPGGNWEGHNILHRKESWMHWAASFGMTEQQLAEELKQSREILLASRNDRIWPGRDEKMIVAWNGLMLSAFARAGMVLQRSELIAVAEKSAAFLLHHLRREDGALWHCRKDGRNQINGFLDDYACFIEGLCDLAEATNRQAYATAAFRLTEKMIELFYDPAAHAFHYTPSDHEKLIVRVRDRYDSAIPSGNNLAVQSLLRLARLCGEEQYRTLAGECLEAMSGTIRQQPSGMGQALMALDLYLGDDEQWVIVPGDLTDANEEAIYAYLKQQLLSDFQPRRMFLFAEPTAADDPLSLTIGKPTVDHQLTLYRCQIGSCQPALSGMDAITEVAFANED